MKIKSISALIMALALGSLALSCADSESRMPLAGAATAVINLGHADSIAEAISPGLPRAAKEIPPPPAVIERVLVRVSGPDIGMIERNFPYSDSISMDVPAGAFRRFEVTAFVAPGDPSAAASFRGTTTVNLPAGASVPIPVMMLLHETKFVIPDALNHRIVQFNRPLDATDLWLDSEDANWHNIPVQVGLPFDFSPSNVDFDGRGRIYFLNENYPYLIYRIENIQSTDHFPYNELNEIFLGITIIDIAIDRARNFLYAATYDANLGSYGVFRINLSQFSNPEFMPVECLLPVVPVGEDTQNLLNDITAIAVGDDGMLIISGTDNNARPSLVKYNPLAPVQVPDKGTTPYIIGTLVGKHYFNESGTFSYAADIMVRGSNIYVLNPTDVQGYNLLQFQFGFVPSIGAPGFTLVNHLGTQATGMDLPQPGEFYGPQQFVCLKQDTLIIIDEGLQDVPWMPVDRLVFTDFDPSRPWFVIGDLTGIHEGVFEFFMSGG